LAISSPDEFFVCFYTAMSLVIADDVRQQYVGCYSQNGGLSYSYYDSSMTVEWCQRKCQQLSYTYFGLKVGLLQLIRHSDFKSAY